MDPGLGATGPFGGWTPYGGAGALSLALVLAFSTAALAYAGTQVRAPLAEQRPGRIVAAFMIVIWALAVATFLIAVRVYVLALHVYVLQLRETGFLSKAPRVHIGTYF